MSLLLAVVCLTLGSQAKSAEIVHGYLVTSDGSLLVVTYKNGKATEQKIELHGIPKEDLKDTMTGVSVAGNKIAISVPGKGIWIGKLGSRVEMSQEVSALDKQSHSIALSSDGRQLAYIKTTGFESAQLFATAYGNLVIRDLASLKERTLANDVVDKNLLWLSGSDTLLYHKRVRDGVSTLLAFEKASLVGSSNRNRQQKLKGFLPSQGSEVGSFITFYGGDGVSNKDYKWIAYNRASISVASSGVPSDLMFDFFGWYGIGLSGKRVLYLAGDSDNASLYVGDMVGPAKRQKLINLKEDIVGGTFVKG